MKKWWVLIMCLILSFSIAGCQGNKAAVQKKTPPPKTVQPQVAEPAHMYPFTGIKTNGDTNHRVIAVMVNNFVKARPQTGLTKADVVYEVLAEGEITRFLAIFQSQMPEKVGPVRSAREYFVDLSQGFHALYVFHGWSPQAKAMLSKGDIDNLNGLKYDGILFHRDPTRKPPHNSYITYKNIEKGAGMNGYSLTDNQITPFPFLTNEETQSLTGDPAKKVNLRYPGGEKVEYDYNAETKLYERSSDGVPTTDRETKERIAVNNVFIVEAEHHLIDSYGRRAINLTSGGKALLIQNGVVHHLSWKNDNGKIVPVGGKFVPGKTWVNIVPIGMDQSVKIQ